MASADEILARADRMVSDRATLDAQWREIVEFTVPDHDRFGFGGRPGPTSDWHAGMGSRSVERGRRRFDDTAMQCVDRLTSGVESIVTPQSEKWHTNKLDDPYGGEGTDEEQKWLERLRDYQFAVRDNPMSGFITANQRALKSCIALGTGVMYLEEGWGKRGRNGDAIPFLYRSIPMSRFYLGVDAQGEADTGFRFMNLTARQAVQRFGDKVSDEIKTAANDTKDQDKTFEIIHAVFPRAGSEHVTRETGAPIAKAPFASLYIERKSRHQISESGFYEFPYIVYSWSPVDEDSPYADGPVAMALAQIKGLNATTKVTMEGVQQYFKPPMAIGHDGLMNRANLNPGAPNYNAVDGNGRLRIQPIITSQRPDFAQQLLEAERANLKDSLYISLFQILAQRRADETATAAMIRAQEKGDLLGPVGSRIQAGLARMIEREVGILISKGAFEPGSPLAPPPSLANKDFGVDFTSPLDRMKQANEGLGIQRTYMFAQSVAQFDPSIMDNLDNDEAVRRISRIEGAPAAIMVDSDERDRKRQAREQQQQAQMTLEMAKTGGEAAKNIVPALGQAQQIAEGQPVA